MKDEDLKTLEGSPIFFKPFRLHVNPRDVLAVIVVNSHMKNEDLKVLWGKP